MAAFVLRAERVRVIRLLMGCNRRVPTLISTIQLQKFPGAGSQPRQTFYGTNRDYLKPSPHLVKLS